MRVIFQKEKNVPNKEIYTKLRIYDSWESMCKIKPNKFGIVILEGDPCTRNIYIHEPDPLNEYSSKVNPKIKKLSFPYIRPKFPDHHTKRNCKYTKHKKIIVIINTM